ncbi:MAG: glycosyltransferase family 1 protein [Pedobacter sp.]|nr:MAG: glycosyltransferase family 1 protein [Pedobacter sp.]
MKIVFDCERMKYPYTGLFEFCHKLGLSLLANKAQMDEVQFYIHQKDVKFFPSIAKKIIKRSIDKFFFQKINPEISIWHTTYQASRYIPPRHKNLKRLLTIHDLNFLHEGKSVAKQEKYLKKHQKNIEKADHIIAISEFTKQDILKHLNVKVPISVIYNGCDMEIFPEYNQPVYLPHKSFIFTVGTVIPKKNFHTLPCLLVNNHLELIIAGKRDEDYIIKILNEAKKYHVEDRVKIIGPITKEDKYWYLKNCQAFVFPSLAEGFGIPVIEAMNFGKPVFISNLTSLPEIGGDAAYYFENFEASYMQRVFSEGIQHYKDNAPTAKILKNAAKYSWQTCAKKHLELYRKLSLI